MKTKEIIAVALILCLIIARCGRERGIQAQDKQAEKVTVGKNASSLAILQRKYYIAIVFFTQEYLFAIQHYI